MRRSVEPDGAKSAIRRVHDRIRGYGGDDRNLLVIMEELKSEGRRFARQLDGLTLKEAYFASANMARGRTFEGKARKGGPR